MHHPTRPSRTPSLAKAFVHLATLCHRPTSTIPLATGMRRIFAKQFDLAQILMAHASGSWLLEAGSFIGGSARTFVRAAKLLNLSTPIVCVDTWAGDVPMWLKKGKNLGPQGSSGEPRLWHQFMANLGREGNHHVIPLQAPAMVGLRYLNELANRGRISRPKVIYLDTAHDCAHVPSTIFFSWNAIFARFRIFLLFLF